ncbi:hypothetical protein NEOKW01_0944 [Nematocida sp. AWRm80]|nr:hypothetical protein NEOKW01_0944 [Nematocida sp. AWRm80]
MKSNELLEIERRVERLLKEEKTKDQEKKKYLEKIKLSIEERKKLCDRLQKEKQERIDIVVRKKEALEKARELLSEKENTEIEKKRKELETEYKQIVNNVNQLEVKLEKRMDSVVKKILQMEEGAKKSGFSNLAQGIRTHLHREIKKFIIESKKLSMAQRADKTIDMLKGLNASIELLSDIYSDYKNRREFYLDVFYEEMLSRFSYHFMGDQETNRLDKPEWYLEYILKDIETYEDIFTIMAQMEEIESEEEDEESIFKEYMHSLLDRITKGIIEIKVSQSIQRKSSQKKQVLLHHAEEVSRYARVLQENYEYQLSLSFSSTEKEHVIGLFKRVSETKLKSVLDKKYIEWMDGLKCIIKENYSIAVALNILVPGIYNDIISHIIHMYLESLSVFINTLTHHKEEEQKILVHFLEEVFYLEEELIEIESDLGISIGTVVILDVSYLHDYKDQFQSILSNIIVDSLQDSLGPLKDYRFIETEEEQIEILANITECISGILRLTQDNRILSLIHIEISEYSDRFFLEIISSAEYPDDLEKIHQLIRQLEEVFAENKIPVGFKEALKAYKKKKESLS